MNSSNSPKPPHNPFLLKPEEAGPDSNLPEGEAKSSFVPQDEAESELAKSADAPFALATFDSSHIKAARDKADALLAKSERFILAEAKDVRDVADAVDTMMDQDGMLDGLDLGAIRNHIQSLMITLRAKPEYVGVLLPRDISNIVKFARDSYVNELETVQMASDKKERRASSPTSERAKKNKSKADMMSSLGELKL